MKLGDNGKKYIYTKKCVAVLREYLENHIQLQIVFNFLINYADM